MKLNLIIFIAISLLQSISGKRVYWPPIGDKTHLIDLEQSLKQHLEKGCTGKDIDLNTDSEQSHFFIPTHTENFGLNDIKPLQFTHIASGHQVDFNRNCTDCLRTTFQFDGKTYQTEHFECRNLCLFKAKRVEGECTKPMQSNYKIYMPFGGKHLLIQEACHRTGLATQLIGSPKRDEIKHTTESLIDRMRLLAHEYLGRDSRKVFFTQPGYKSCTTRCMPVCWQPSVISDFDADDDFETYGPTEVTLMPKMMSDDHVKMFAASLMKNLCNYSQPKGALAETARLVDFACSSANTFLSSLAMLVIASVAVIMV